MLNKFLSMVFIAIALKFDRLDLETLLRQEAYFRHFCGPVEKY